MGLPAFEDETRFLAVEQDGLAPVVFLQSLQRPDLAFPAIPVRAIVPTFELALSADEVKWLGGDEDLLALAILTISSNHVTANLRAPVVVNQKTRVGLQAIQADSAYSHQYVLEEAPCS
jgi:flagellar assembly factor FliW